MVTQRQTKMKATCSCCDMFPPPRPPRRCRNFWSNPGGRHFHLPVVFCDWLFNPARKRWATKLRARPASSHPCFTSAEWSSDEHSRKKERAWVPCSSFDSLLPTSFHLVSFGPAPYLIYDSNTIICIYYVLPPSYTEEREIWAINRAFKFKKNPIILFDPHNHLGDGKELSLENNR